MHTVIDWSKDYDTGLEVMYHIIVYFLRKYTDLLHVGCRLE